MCSYSVVILYRLEITFKFCQKNFFIKISNFLKILKQTKKNCLGIKCHKDDEKF
ncbi:unnamed protein product [Meloidogyne enterolobii]|uniref:Uncharacterized protein n=1 Tax=Meloidogyne enterolobii TaxID=390850 RepID=A0ACB0Z4Y2_MELEN